jgi:hypothetical protein
MLVPQSGDTIALVLPGVIVIADADQCRLEQMHGCRQHLFPWQSPQRHMFRDSFPNPRKQARKLHYVLELGTFAEFAELGVIAILLAPLRVAASRLHVAVAVGADPDVGPSRGNCQPPDAPESTLVLDRRSPRAEISEPLARPSSPNARLLVAHIAQARLFGCIAPVGDVRGFYLRRLKHPPRSSTPRKLLMEQPELCS